MISNFNKKGFLSVILKEICSNKDEAKEFAEKFRGIYGDLEEKVRVNY
jgi:hypothetical protein